jgi:hypothetical protein
LPSVRRASLLRSLVPGCTIPTMERRCSTPRKRTMTYHQKHDLLYKLGTLATALALTVGWVSSASAVTCNIPFPTNGDVCEAGTSSAIFRHVLVRDPLRFQLAINMLGGTVGAVAYGIDENGNQLNRPETTVADDDPDPERFSGVPANQLYGGDDTTEVPPERFYQHPLNMASTFVIVL